MTDHPPDKSLGSDLGRERRKPNMNRPKATRLRLSLAIAVVAAFAVILPGTASADFASGTGLTVTFANPTPGAHSDMTVTHTYNYDNIPTGSGAAPMPPYPNPFADGYGKTGDDLKQWILETPIGFYGNPSAIPFDKRCTQDQMNGYVKSQPMPGYLGYPGTRCPDSAQIGTATLSLGVDAPGPYGPTTVLQGKIYVVQSANPLQEVPTTLFTVFSTHVANCDSISMGLECVTAALSRTQIAPVTGETSPNYRLRAVSEVIDRPDLSASAGQPDGTVTGYIKGISQTLWGVPADHGNADAVAPFQTNPNTCGDWNSSLFSRTYGNAGPVGAETAISTASQSESLVGTAEPGGGDASGSYAKFDSPPTAATNCDQAAALTQTVTGSVDNNARGAYPGLTVAISNPDSDNRDKASKMVTTLPASISINAAALGNICQEADLVADTCPANSMVGTADINSPILSATQHGRVYMTKGTTQGLPFLSIWVNGPNDNPAGAFKFRLDATTKFVGSSANMIETTFDKLPQLPFDSFTVHINGGDSNNSLLLNRVCPGDGATPADGPITFVTSGYAGSSAAFSSATALNPCYGVAKPSKVSKCVKVGKKLSVKPKELIATSTIANVKLLTGTKSKSLKQRAKDSKAPFSFKLTLKKSKFKKNRKYFYGYKVSYKDGHVIKTKTNTFKTCK